MHNYRPLATTSDCLVALSARSHLARKLIHRRIVQVGVLHRVHYRRPMNRGRFSSNAWPTTSPMFHNRPPDDLSASKSAGCYSLSNPRAPQQDVGIQVVIVLQSLCFTTQRVVALVAVNVNGETPNFTHGLISRMVSRSFLIRIFTLLRRQSPLSPEASAINGQSWRHPGNPVL